MSQTAQKTQPQTEEIADVSEAKRLLDMAEAAERCALEWRGRAKSLLPMSEAVLLRAVERVAADARGDAEVVGIGTRRTWPKVEDPAPEPEPAPEEEPAPRVAKSYASVRLERPARASTLAIDEMIVASQVSKDGLTLQEITERAGWTKKPYQSTLGVLAERRGLRLIALDPRKGSHEKRYRFIA